MSASDLMRALGLLVDGPARWGYPVPSRAPGVFVFELPAGLDKAPIDHGALRRWLEYVPDLRLDGSRPTTGSLADRLAAFWLPREPIVFIGRSTRALGPRVAAFYATRLGDARPNPNGHWLKTLSVVSQLRLWWAETGAHEEYLDALLGEVAGRAEPSVVTALPDPQVVLPFANLETADGTAKRHGIENPLRDPADSPARRTGEPSPSVATPRRKAQPASPRARRPSSTAAATRPKPAATYLSKDGLDRLQDELDQLRSGVRPEVIARVKAARELGDLRENAEYESARKEQSFVEGRIQALEALVRAAVVVDAPIETGAAVGVGSTVTVEADGEQHTYVLVGSAEADPAKGRISYTSPVGQALLNKRPGDDAVARLPRGEMRMTIREVR
ncbi:MAG: transcription elongation factor GreA [Chloroflexota bacterium]|nr:transcription elongation factor GreA [Chloroflexota bacterium]